MPNRLSQAAQHRLNALIERYQLYQRGSLPVPIRSIAESEGWEIRAAAGLDGMYGYALITEHYKIMRIDAYQPEYQQRYTIGHEMGHDLNGDRWGMHYCQDAPEAFVGWVRRRAEHRASLVAARLLIPTWVWEEESDIALVAAACQVSEEVALLAARDMRRHCRNAGRCSCPFDRYQFATVAGLALSAITLAREYLPGWQDVIPGLGTISGLF